MPPEPAVAAPVVPDPPVRRADPPVLTPSGLPFRQREPAPAGEPSRPAAGNGQAAVPGNASIGRAGRAPDDMRSIMASYRSGTLRGRLDAARLTETNAETNAGMNSGMNSGANAGANAGMNAGANAETSQESPEWTPPEPEQPGTDEER
jgi:hypothetical protein